MCARSKKNLKEKKQQINLLTAIKDHNSGQPVMNWKPLKMYGTPKAQDSRAALIDRGKSNLGEQVHQEHNAKKLGGRLNPNFVEFLMGYNMNYTKIELKELKHLETQSYHKSQQKSEKQLLKPKK